MAEAVLFSLYLLGDQIIDINGARVSECPIDKIKDIIRSSPEYIVCTVKPVTHYTSHEDSPQMPRSAYTEVDPDALHGSDSEYDDEDETAYTQVEISAQSMEDLCRDSSTKENAPRLNGRERGGSDGGFRAYANSEASDQERTSLKKQTNYAELEFGAR